MQEFIDNLRREFEDRLNNHNGSIVIYTQSPRFVALYQAEVYFKFMNITPTPEEKEAKVQEYLKHNNKTNDNDTKQ